MEMRETILRGWRKGRKKKKNKRIGTLRNSSKDTRHRYNQERQQKDAKKERNSLTRNTPQKKGERERGKY